MEQQFPMALEVALIAASGAVILLAFVVVYAVLRMKRQLNQVVTAVESFETELIPLARETRVVVDRLRNLSELAQRDWLVVEDVIATVRRWTERTEQVVGAASGVVLSPVRAVNRTAQLLQTGATTFFQVLWNGRPRTEQRERPS